MQKFFVSLLSLFSLVLIISFGFMVNDSIKKRDKSEAIITYKLAKVKTKKEMELKCLTDNIYYEAAHEPLSGKRAVAFVTLNRVNNSSFPNSICKVVYQKKKSTCQFSWVCGASKGYNKKEYETSRIVAKKIYKNYENMYDISNGSLYFHAEYVNPSWASKKFFTKKIGKHLFYTAIPNRKS